MNHTLKKRKQPSGERPFPGEGEGMSKVREGRKVMIQCDTRQVIRCGWRGKPKLRNAAAGRTEADHRQSYIPRRGICPLCGQCRVS